ncbi:MAG: T9SS type A sorting domain-containing protein [Prolixibacteraceae bacterium]
MKKIFTLVLMMLTASVMFGQATHSIDFEFDGVGADWYWLVASNGDNPALEFVENPSYDDLNESATVAKFIAKQAGDPWCFFKTDDNGLFTFDSTNCIVTLMVYKTVLSDIGFKVEGGTGPVTTLVHANLTADAWEVVSFDFSALIGESYDGILIMPDNAGGRTEDLVIYIDNIQVPNGGEDAVENSVANFATNKLKLYPNPVSDLVTIPGVEDGEMVKVYNMTGALVKSIPVNQGVVLLGDLVNGMYYVSANGATVKIIKE